MRDTTKPLFHWYTESHLGMELIIALYTPPCKFKCAFCSLPKLSDGGENVSATDIDRQVDWTFSQYNQPQLEAIKKVSLYLAGSGLDTNNLPTSSLIYFLRKAINLSNIQVFSLETRPEYVTGSKLDLIQGILGDVRLEISIGYETHDLKLRNKVLNKGLTSQNLTKLVRLLGTRNAWLKAYLMLKPHHSLTEQDGVQEAIRGLSELSLLGKIYQVPMMVGLNTTYIAKGSSNQDEMLRNGYLPPKFESILAVLDAGCKLGIPIQVGADDEGLSVSGETFRSNLVDRKVALAALKRFNRHQNINRLMMETDSFNPTVIQPYERTMLLN
jgi:radical SAM enzyme (TIGR01210 family)